MYGVPGAPFTDIVTFVFTNNNSTAGITIPLLTNAVIFTQPLVYRIAYLSFSYATTGSNPGTVNISLYDMTGVTYDNTTLGTLIGPSAVASLTPGISTTCTIFTVNTSALTPAGPYASATNRPVAVRISTGNANRFVLLSITIGYGV